MRKITILITEDHALVRDGLELLLNKDPGFKVIGKVQNCEEIINLIGLLRPDIILMDINLPGINGIEAIHTIKKISPATKVLGVSMHTHPAMARKMMKKGAKGYVTKCSPSEELVKAIVEIHNNRNYICDIIKNKIASPFSNGNSQKYFDSLSKREIEVIEFVKKGFTSKEIADSLRVCLRTVEAHRYNILKKLKLKNTPALINYVNTTSLNFQ